MPSSLSNSYSIHLSPKYVSQQPVFKHPYRMLALNVGDFFTPTCNNMQVLCILIRIYLKSTEYNRIF